MGSSVPPRSIHRIHATTHGTTRNQRLALTGPRSALQHSDSRRLSHLHKSTDLSTSPLTLDHRWATWWNHRRRQGWTGIHGGSRSLPLNPRSNGAGRALHLSRRNLGRLSKHSSSTTGLLPDRGRDRSSGKRPLASLSPSIIAYRSSLHSERGPDTRTKRWSDLCDCDNLWTSSLADLAWRDRHSQVRFCSDTWKAGIERKPEHRRPAGTENRSNPPDASADLRNPTHLNYISPIPSADSGSVRATPRCCPRHARSAEHEPPAHKP